MNTQLLNSLGEEEFFNYIHFKSFFSFLFTDCNSSKQFQLKLSSLSQKSFNLMIQLLTVKEPLQMLCLFLAEKYILSDFFKNIFFLQQTVVMFKKKKILDHFFFCIFWTQLSVSRIYRTHTVVAKKKLHHSPIFTTMGYVKSFGQTINGECM